MGRHGVKRQGHAGGGNDMRLARRGMCVTDLLVALLALAAGGCRAGPVVAVVDAESMEPISGATVRAERWTRLTRTQRFTGSTDGAGRVRLPWEPGSIFDVHVDADGYAPEPVEREPRDGPGGGALAIQLARPVWIDVELVLPDERRAVLNVYEGEVREPPTRGTRERIQPRHLSVPIRWDDEPPPLPESHPLLRMNLVVDSPHRDTRGAAHRVTAARTADGRRLPVYRDAPPADGGFGLYHIGRGGFGDAVFVIGTLDEARAAEAAAPKFQWVRNTKVLGAATGSAAPS